MVKYKTYFQTPNSLQLVYRRNHCQTPMPYATMTITVYAY